MKPTRSQSRWSPPLNRHAIENRRARHRARRFLFDQRWTVFFAGRPRRHTGSRYTAQALRQAASSSVPTATPLMSANRAAVLDSMVESQRVPR